MKMVAVNESEGRVERKEAKCTSAMVARKSRFLGRRRPERSDYFESHTSFASECSTRLLTLSGKRTTFSPPRLRFLRSQTKKRRNKKEKGGKKKEIREEGVVFSQVSEERKEMAPLLPFSNPHQKEREMSWPVCLSFLAGLLPFLVNNSRGSRYS